jgi:riboflavin kinase/FMN adenylyltransferase
MYTLISDIHQLALPTPLAGAESVLTVGAFDGIHIGHQDLIAKLIDRARHTGRISALITFDPHPAAVLHPEEPFYYLTTSTEKRDLVEPLGLDVLVVLNFDLDLAGLPPRAFVQRLSERMRMREMWIGPDFALGRQRQGDVARLRHLGNEHGFEVYDIPYVTQGAQRVSSSTIRALLQEGRVDEVSYLLGRPYALSGKVVPGARRGHDLGFPTANVSVAPDRALPAYGVYATYARLGSERYRSVTNVGVRPTFDNGACSVEAYLMDFAQDIYGRELAIDFVARLRPEKRFAGVQELIVQMEHDVERARQIL